MGWIMQNDTLTNTDFISLPDVPFHDDSPYTMWRIDPNVNEGMPYVPLMIGVPVEDPKLYLGDVKITKIYCGDSQLL